LFFFLSTERGTGTCFFEHRTGDRYLFFARRATPGTGDRYLFSPAERPLEKETGTGSRSPWRTLEQGVRYPLRAVGISANGYLSPVLPPFQPRSCDKNLLKNNKNILTNDFKVL
jgi:hypothetical protein